MIYYTPFSEFYLTNLNQDLKGGTIVQLAIPDIEIAEHDISVNQMSQYPSLYRILFNGSEILTHTGHLAQVKGERKIQQFSLLDLKNGVIEIYPISFGAKLCTKLRNGNYLVIPDDHEVDNGMLIQEISLQ